MIKYSYTFRDIFYSFDKRLNDPVWILDKLHRSNVYEIAYEIGCSVSLVEKKINEVHLFECKDTIFRTHTGYFHFTKRFIPFLLRPFIKKITWGIDTVYDKTTSQNSKIFKKIVQELEELDKDSESSALTGLGINRKEGYLLAMKFVICLYEYDSYYIERMEYILKRIKEEQEHIKIDQEISKSSNWYPHRNNLEFMKFMLNRNK